MLGFLIIGTLAVVWIVFRSIALGSDLLPALILAGAFTGLWIAYLDTQKMGKTVAAWE